MSDNAYDSDLDNGDFDLDLDFSMFDMDDAGCVIVHDDDADIDAEREYSSILADMGIEYS